MSFKSLSVCSPTYLSTLVCYDHNIQCVNVIIAASWKETFLLRTSKMILDPKSTLIFFNEKKTSSFLKIQNDNISISKYSTTILACGVEDKGNTQ